MADLCGAKTRSGGECKNSALQNGRCRFHGGASTGAPKGNTNAATHGIYQQRLTDSEREQYSSLELGAVDHELRLTRIRLSRALAAEQIAAGLPEMEEVTQNDGGGVAVPHETRKSKVRDYYQLIDRLTARVGKLELIRKTLDASNGANDDIEGFEVVEYEKTE